MVILVLVLVPDLVVNGFVLAMVLVGVGLVGVDCLGCAVALFVAFGLYFVVSTSVIAGAVNCDGVRAVGVIFVVAFIGVGVDLVFVFMFLRQHQCQPQPLFLLLLAVVPEWIFVLVLLLLLFLVCLVRPLLSFFVFWCCRFGVFGFYFFGRWTAFGGRYRCRNGRIGVVVVNCSYLACCYVVFVCLVSVFVLFIWSCCGQHFLFVGHLLCDGLCNHRLDIRDHRLENVAAKLASKVSTIACWSWGLVMLVRICSSLPGLLLLSLLALSSVGVGVGVVSSVNWRASLEAPVVVVVVVVTANAVAWSFFGLSFGLLLLLFVLLFVLISVLLVVLLFLLDAPPGGPPGGGSAIGASLYC